jgi:hypothetical protein
VRARTVHRIADEAAHARGRNGIRRMGLAMKNASEGDDAGKKSSSGEGHIRNIEFTGHDGLQSCRAANKSYLLHAFEFLLDDLFFLWTDAL